LGPIPAAPVNHAANSESLLNQEHSFRGRVRIAIVVKKL
jgi:hypothetical protein